MAEKARSLFPYLLALVLGGIGGALFFWIGTPLPWMMGAMFATTCAALARAPIKASTGLRSAFIVVLGVLLGSTFSPGMIDAVGQWSVSLAAMIGYVIAVGFLLCFLMMRVTGYDRATCYFSTAPGGLSEMIIIGGAMGGNERVISLVHSARILFVVFSLPFFFDYTQESYRAAAAAVGHGGPDVRDVLILAGAGICGAILFVLLRVPAAQLLGPMLFSAAVHLMGWTDAAPPTALVAIAQIVIGSTIGARFVGIEWREVVHPVGMALVLTIVMIAASAGFAWILQPLVGAPFDALWLAFSPGGVAEMSLIALALHLDPAFVATHHVFRILMVILLAPLAYRIAFTRRT